MKRFFDVTSRDLYPSMEAFENYFKEADLNNDGKIGRFESVIFLSRFGLPNQVVEQMWTYINHDKSGFLGRSEFFDALRLATVAQSGRALTPEIVKSALHGPTAAQIPAPQIKSIWPTHVPQGTRSLAMLFPNPTAPPYSQTNEFTPTRYMGAESPQLITPNLGMNHQILPTSSAYPFQTLGITEGLGLIPPSPSPSPLQALEPYLGSQGSMPVCEQFFHGNIEDICAKLQVALADAAKYRFELNEEIFKREKAEMELVSLIQKVKESENALLRELDLRESRLNLLQEENKKLQEERDNAVKEVEESENALFRELDFSETLLYLLQEENKKLQEERDNAVKEVEESENALFRKLDFSKSLLYLLQEENKKLQEENKKLQEERDNAVKEVEESENALFRELDFSKILLYFLQEENKKLHEERDNAVKEVEELRNSAGPGSYEVFSKFSMLELQQATDNFNNSHKIGEGGFGCVYKGFLRNTMVAIKMLHPESLQGKQEFEQEVAILSTTRHPNLVTLIGTCSEQSALVYEYLPNGSLEDRLACQGGTPPLTWQMRTRIIGEICCALLFLHSNKPNPIVHADLKPANILLDANLVSKLSDFGISRLLIKYTTNTLVHHTENPKGTFAYMDPKFLRSGQLTVKSDVYSFGIIIFQLLTGKPPLNIIPDVENAVNDNCLHSIMDKSAGEWPFVQAQQLTKLGLRCTQMHRRKRPDLESEWKLVESLMTAASLSVVPSFKSQLDDKGIPSYFMCPIFQEVMKDPNIAADGYTYEAEAIKGWLDGRHETSPMTNLPLDHLELTPNRALRSAIQEWLQQHP